MKVGDKVFVVSSVSLKVYETRITAINYGSSSKYDLCFGRYSRIGEIYTSEADAKAYRDNFIANTISDLQECINGKEKPHQSWFSRLFCNNSIPDKVKQVETPLERLYIGDILYKVDHYADGYLESYCIDKVKDVGGLDNDYHSRYLYYLRNTKYMYVYDSSLIVVRTNEINKDKDYFTSKLLAYKALVKKLTALQENFSKKPYGVNLLNRYGF